MKRKDQLSTTALGLVAMLGGLVAPAAFAQDTEERDEIIVTATKRDERLVDVPISMSVMGEEDIAQTGIRELKAVSEYIPNVQITQHNDNGATVTIRGVGSNSRNIGFDTRVGVYVDGIYMGQSPSLNQELLDLQQIEILRGPQGTLFGKDTVAGAVNIITKKPGDELEGKISADVGNMNYTELKGVVNLPLGEGLALKVGVSKADRDGFVLNTQTGNLLGNVDKMAYRFQLRYEPTDQLEVNWSFDGLNAANRTLNGEPVTDMLGLFPLPLDREVDFDFDPGEHRDVYGSTFTVDYQFDNGFSLKSLTGWRDTDAFYTNATDYSPTSIVFIEYAERYKQVSQEFQVSSPDGDRLTYVAGLYLYSQDGTTNRDVIFGDRFNEDFIGFIIGAPGAPDSVTGPIAAALGFGPEGSAVSNFGLVKTRNIAGYFNADYDLTDRLKLGVGARYSVVNKDADWILDGRNSGFFGIGSTNVAPGSGAAPTPLINDRSDKSFDPAISLTFAATDETNVYAKYSSGFKSGGFNLDYINSNELAANSGLEFGKEKADSFEVGMKGLFMDGALAINTAAFLTKYSDYQVNQFIILDPTASPPLTSIRITNAAEVTTRGIELEAQFKPTDSLTFQGSIGLLDATFDSFPGGASGGLDASGKKLPAAPDFSASLGVQYYHYLPDMQANLLIRGDMNHRSGIFQSIDNTKTATYGAVPGSFDFGYAEPLTLFNGRIGFLPDNSKFELYFWGRNLTDQTPVIQDFQDFFGTKVRYSGIGRTWGVEGVMNF